MATDAATLDSSGDDPRSRMPGDGDCWNHIGVSGDRSCPELNTFIHCRNCPVFATAARIFLDRRAPEGYLADWSRWLADSTGEARGDEAERDDDHALLHGEAVSVLIFCLGEEWLASPGPRRLPPSALTLALYIEFLYRSELGPGRLGQSGLQRSSPALHLAT